MRNEKQLNPVVARFEKSWREGKRPWILEILNEVDEQDRESILPELISIDIHYRVSSGDCANAKDYYQLGPTAVELALQQLLQSGSSRYSEKDLAVTSDDSCFDDASDAGSYLNQDLAVTSDDSFDSRKDDATDVTMDSPKSKTSTTNGSKANGGPPKFIGPYKLLEQIGEGGMGSVWLAEQSEPVRRRVALKVIRGEVDSQAAIVRFEAERQAIALMEHQNIAKILDAGTTESGNPYFAMELVDGIPLNDFCNRKKLGIRERLELMIPVCRAIHHAHQKGIIHRDLKHSNVLVTQYDGQPVPKVIDFGLAKAFETQSKLTEETIFTEYGRVVGTLQYMSPEQAELNSMDIDTRSDIYSLGVMIYKLLTGTTPLDTEGKDAKSLVEILDLIRTQEAQKPSDRLAGFDAPRLQRVADRHGVKPEKLIQQARSDVDWIVMKSIEKDRDRRYESANGLALELDRFLHDQEVRACPPSTVYRVEKFYRRNKKLVAALSAIAIALFLGAIGTCYGLFWALNEQEIAKIEAANAVAAKNEAQQAQSLAETRLKAIRIKSAYSDWQLGNVESAWQGFSQLDPDDRSWESQFLQTELSSSRNVMYGHAMAVNSIDASRDGRFIATTSQDHTVKIWDANSTRILHTVLTSELPNQVCFSPDSTRVAYVDRSNCVTLFDSETGENSRTFGPFGEDITCLDFLDDGSKLIMGTSSLDLEGFRGKLNEVAEVKPVIRILSVDDGSVIAELAGHSKTINAVSWSSDGKFIVSCGDDSTIRIWRREGNTYSESEVLKAHFPGVADVKISPTAEVFASCGKDSTVRLWDLKTGELIQTMVGHRDQVNGLCFSPDGQLIISASSDQTARIWSLSGVQQRAYQGHFDEINKVCFSADGARFFTASDDHTVRFDRSTSKNSTLAVRIHHDVVWQTVFTPDGKRLISVGEDGRVLLSDTQTGKPCIDEIKLDEAVLCVAHSPVADFFVTGDEIANIRVWDSQTGKLLRTIAAHEGFVWDLSFSRDGKLLASASADNTFKIWKTDDWSEQHCVSAHEGELGSVRFSDDGNYLVSAGDDKKVKLWDVSSGQLKQEFEGHRTGVWRAIFSPTNPNLIASSSYDGEIILWEIGAPIPLHARINAHKNQVAGLAFTHDGTRVVSASDDQTIKFWDVKTGIELFVLRDTDDSAIVAVAFSNDGAILASGNQEGWVTIRSANKLDDNYQPVLPMDLIQLARDISSALMTECETSDDFERELKKAELCSRHFPSYVTRYCEGIALYRLGRIDESIAALLEAQRLEPIMYGEPDLPPYIEGFLTLAYLKREQFEKSQQVEAVFREKCKAKIWNNSEPIPDLLDEIDAEKSSAASAQ